MNYKHIFIVNPQAGAESPVDEILQKLEKLGRPDCEFYLTQAPLDATKYVSERCREAMESGDTVYRFYACGGDGTLNEVAAGAADCPLAEVACYPCGSGNDYVKYYGGSSFFTIEGLFGGKAEKIDLLSVNGRTGINACHFGFDSYVAEMINRIRRKPLIGGKNAYNTGVFMGIFNAMNNHCHVVADGETLNEDGNMLLCTVTNGTHVGGSYMCAPRSDNTDDYLEVCFVKNISISTFLKLMKSYQAGTHLDDARLKNILIYRRAKSVHVTCRKPMSVSIDGELISSDDFTVNVCHNALNFVVPVGTVNRAFSLTAQPV